jgi:hypothetical protein
MNHCGAGWWAVLPKNQRIGTTDLTSVSPR